MIANKNGEFTTSFTYVNSAVRLPFVKYVAYIKHIGETPRNNKSVNTPTSAYGVCLGGICLSIGETIKRGETEGLFKCNHYINELSNSYGIWKSLIILP